MPIEQLLTKGFVKVLLIYLYDRQHFKSDNFYSLLIYQILPCLSGALCLTFNMISRSGYVLNGTSYIFTEMNERKM